MIRLERDGDLAIILLDRPDKRNALTPEALDLLIATIHQAAPARAIILAGAGPVFCGGFDLKLCLDRPGTLDQLLRGLADLIILLRSIDKPVLIAAHGAAIAGGCALLAAADFVITDDTAKIGYPVIPLGISPAVSAATLRHTIGDGPCRERLLDPALISGREAARIGLVHESVPAKDDVLPRTKSLARALLEKPAPAYAATKSWLREITTTLEPRAAGTKALDASLSITNSEEEHARLTVLFIKHP